MVPEGVPAERLKILSDSFMAATKDPELLQDAKKAHLEINAIDGDAVHEILVKMFATPQPIVDKVAEIFTAKE